MATKANKPAPRNVPRKAAPVTIEAGKVVKGKLSPSEVMTLADAVFSGYGALKTVVVSLAAGKIDGRDFYAAFIAGRDPALADKFIKSLRPTLARHYESIKTPALAFKIDDKEKIAYLAPIKTRGAGAGRTATASSAVAAVQATASKIDGQKEISHEEKVAMAGAILAQCEALMKKLDAQGGRDFGKMLETFMLKHGIMEPRH